MTLGRAASNPAGSSCADSCRAEPSHVGSGRSRLGALRGGTQSIAGAGLLLFGLKLAGAALGLGMHLVLARLMGVAAYGDFATAFNAATLIAVFAAAGMPMTASRFLPAYLGRGQSAEALGYLEAVAAATLVGGLLGGLCLSATALLPSFADPGLVAALLAAGPLVLLLAAAQTGTALLQAFARPIAAEFPILVLRPLLVSAVCAILALPAIGRLDAAGALIVIDLVTAAMLVPVGVVLWRAIRGHALGGARRRLTGHWAQSGALLMLLVGGAALNERLDVMMIAILAEPEAAGIYSAAARLAAPISLGTAAATVRALPLMAEQFARGAREEAGRTLAQTSRTALLLAGAAALPLGAGSPLLLGLFGPDFRNGALALCLLALAHIALAAGGAASSALIASGNERRIVHVTALGLVVNVLSNLALVPAFGMNGAAAATCAAMAATGLGLVIAAGRVLGLNAFTGRDLRARDCRA